MFKRQFTCKSNYSVHANLILVPILMHCSFSFSDIGKVVMIERALGKKRALFFFPEMQMIIFWDQ